MSDKIASVTSKDDPGVIEKARLDSLTLVEETRVIVGKKYESDRQVAGEEFEANRLEAGEEFEANRLEAGEVELAKQESGYLNSPKAQGSTEAQIYGEVTTHATGITALEVAKTGYEVLARGQDPAAGHGQGSHVKTMDQLAKPLKQTPISQGIRKSLGITTSPIEDSADGLLARTKLTKDFQSKNFGIKNQADKLDGKYVATTEVVGGMKLASLKKLAMAQKAAFVQTQELSSEARHAPVLNGMGSGAPGMNHDKFGHLTPTKTFLKDNAEEGSGAIA